MIITGATLPDDTASNLLNCMERGENHYTEYRESRIVNKSKCLFDTISFKSGTKKKKNATKVTDLRKVHTEFTRTIDIARVRGYCVRTLLSYEITSTSLFLTKDGFLRKSTKSELLELVRTQQIQDSEFKPAPKQRVVIVDFMAEARKIESWRKKGKVKTFGDAVIEIWKSCTKMIEQCNRIDFVFDLYLINSIKSSERQRRSAKESTRIVITHLDQELPSVNQVNKKPSEFEKFWALTENKIGLQHFFITWVTETYKGEIPVYLGGCNIENENVCSKIVNGNVSTVQCLECFYDEADDRLMYHLNNAVKCDHVEVAHILTGDTDIYVNLMYNFSEWSEYGLNEIWFHHLNRMSPIHDSVQNLPSNVVQLLPTIHALTGCDTTSKVGTKLQAYKAAHKPEYASLNKFGISELDECMYETAEHFLLECVTRQENRNVNTFDEMRYSKYHSHNLKLDLEKFPCTSKSIRFQIQKAYYQRRLWFLSSREKRCDLDPQLYSYELNDEGLLVPLIVNGDVTPRDFPFPCQCGKCTKDTVCICRVNKVECCDFCKCKRQCKNPNNPNNQSVAKSTNSKKRRSSKK